MGGVTSTGLLLHAVMQFLADGYVKGLKSLLLYSGDVLADVIHKKMMCL